jgi:hypothetical protein
VLALGVVKVQPGANTGLGFVNSRISMEVDLFVFETVPQPLDKDVVHDRPLPSMLIMTLCRFRVPVKSSYWPNATRRRSTVDHFRLRGRVGSSSLLMPRRNFCCFGEAAMRHSPLHSPPAPP